MIQTYSLAFIPNEEVSTTVKQMKNQLASEIGWFHSCNALAHITVCEFKMEEDSIKTIEKQIETIANTIKPVTVSLDSINSYPNGALFLNPNKISKESLKVMMKAFQTRLKVPYSYKSTDPHLSIARKLNEEKLHKAENLFTIKPLAFCCNSISVRKLDLVRKQFVIINTFPFNSQSSTTSFQTNLF